MRKIEIFCTICKKTKSEEYDRYYILTHPEKTIEDICSECWFKNEED